MKYDTSNPREAGEAVMHLNSLIGEKKKVDIKAIKPRRSLNQNAFLHLLLGIFGSNLGYTLAESKELYKRLPGNKEVYQYTKDVGGKPMTFLRSSADLDKATMQKTIDNLREWSAKMGHPLPSADDKEWLMRAENEVERHEYYL